jgi:hypothetical protein
MTKDHESYSVVKIKTTLQKQDAEDEDSKIRQSCPQINRK